MKNGGDLKMSQMNKKILVIILFVLGITNLYAQSDIVDVQLVYNNLTDVDASLSNNVKVAELEDAIQSNDNDSFVKNLIVRIAFFDKNVVGRMKLKEEHKMSVENYVVNWEKMVENKNAVLFLFVKAYGKDAYDFDKMYVSTKLSNDHLLPLVAEYINEHLTGNNNEIISNGTHYLANAIRPVWTEEKMKQAVEMTKKPKYWKNHFNYFHKDWEYPIIDFRHTSANDVNNYAIVGCYNANKEKVDEGTASVKLFLSDQIIYTKTEILDKCTISSTKYDIRFDVEKIDGIYTMYSGLLYNILNQVENCGKTNKSLVVSKWSWNNNKEISNRDNLINRTNDDKFIMYWDSETYNSCEGEEMPQYVQYFYCHQNKNGEWSRTYCNVFACDLANEVLFGNIFGRITYGPWGKHRSANDLYNVIDNDENKQFKKIEKGVDDPWIYTNNGYVVYLTSYNSSGSGHIATCYPDEKKIELKKRVVQGGSRTEVLQWNGYTNIHIYLGYILK